MIKKFFRTLFVQGPFFLAIITSQPSMSMDDEQLREQARLKYPMDCKACKGTGWDDGSTKQVIMPGGYRAPRGTQIVGIRCTDCWIGKLHPLTDPWKYREQNNGVNRLPPPKTNRSTFEKHCEIL